MRCVHTLSSRHESFATSRGARSSSLQAVLDGPDLERPEELTSLLRDLDPEDEQLSSNGGLPVAT